jgi:aerobic-type carbon monoxide dehydrogenase small subunit (CoxS/CutS family)
MLKELKLTVNGQPYELSIHPRTLLVEVLREHLGLTGTKRGCNEGACGACTVVMNGKSVKSCSVLALSANGAEITTVEGLAKGAELHPLQKAFLDYGAYQCGFCTGGMLMSCKGLLNMFPNPTNEQIRDGIDGNICRCTGYNSIIRAVEAVSRGDYKETK